jgi:hypothetical protein
MTQETFEKADFEKMLASRPTSSSLVKRNILPDPKIPVQFVEQAKELENKVIKMKLVSSLETRPEKSKLEGRSLFFFCVLFYDCFFRYFT